jgi:aquaporin Z
MQTTSTAAVTQMNRRPGGWLQALSSHWPEYLMEAAELGLFMLSACLFTALLEHPRSLLRQGIDSAILRRLLNGIAMGLTLVALVYSKLGKRSGAHLNPSVTLTFLSLGKIEPWDAAFYVAAQFAGGLLGVIVARLAGVPLSHPSVNYVVTQPGPAGTGIAFLAELLISGAMMSAVLVVSNTPALSRFTGVFAAVLLALFITFEAPLSGVSLSPARTLGSAIPARFWTALWIYFLAPPLGMFLAGLAYRSHRGAYAVFCAKLHHHNGERCIFRCNFAAM